MGRRIKIAVVFYELEVEDMRVIAGSETTAAF